MSEYEGVESCDDDDDDDGDDNDDDRIVNVRMWELIDIHTCNYSKTNMYITLQG